MNNQFPPIDWYARPDSWTYRMPGFSSFPGSWRVPTPPLASGTSYQSEPTDYSADAPSTQGILGQFSRPINAPTSPRAWNATFSMPTQLNTEPVNFLPADHPALRIHLPSQVEWRGPQAPGLGLGLSTDGQTDMAGLPDQLPPRPREEPGAQSVSFNPLRLGSNAALRALMRLAPERIVLDSLMAAAPSLLTLPQQALDAAANFEQRGDPGPILEAALLPMGGTFAGAPRAALGAGPTRRLPMDEASRMARADELGFHRDMPLEIGQAPAGEKIASAAIDVGGRTFTGANHEAAIREAEIALGKPVEDMAFGPMPQGFVTTSGRYVSRREADYIAQATGQGEARGRFGAVRGLASEQVTMAPTSPRRTRVQEGATASGLPGGQGVWGWAMESGPTARALSSGHGTPPSAAMELIPAAGSAANTPVATRNVPAWHRADHPGTFDVRGRADHEIQATLQNAWDLGHDAVLLRNYTAPNGRVGDVLVVKDPAQLRSPSARFNPVQRDSRNLLAGIAGGAVAYPLLADPNQE